MTERFYMKDGDVFAVYQKTTIPFIHFRNTSFLYNNTLFHALKYFRRFIRIE